MAVSADAYTQISNQREKKIAAARDTLFLDSLSIIPSTFELFFHNEPLDSSAYTLDFISGRVVLSRGVSYDTLEVKYRVFPKALKHDYRNKPLSLIRAEGSDNFSPFVIGGNGFSSSFLEDDALQKSGNISRGIAFGNAQNLSVNSALNLQLSGRLTDRYSLLASVSDNNIPIQPDGNTQQLQDFDQVFIQLYDDRSKLIAGDFILRKPTGYFLNFFKRAQGAYTLVKSDPSSSKGALSVEASASISKGRFARNIIQGIEGSQGPYRLQGADGEAFIIVLAGTEAVYIDGRLLERGQDKDYVMDYNSSEVTFTPRQFITKDRRIVVEFQYSEKRYARPLLQASITKGLKGKSMAYFNIYSENDAKNQPLQQDLNNQEKSILAMAGDNLLAAVLPGSDSVAFSNTQVLYWLTDSLGFDSIFIYSTDTARAHYRVSFTLVGAGRGDYTEDGFTANGRKFKWIEPILQGNDTLHRGNYAPIILLASPKKKQMLSVGVRLDLSQGSSERQWDIEGALSNNDLNTFSSLDSQDDLGYALRTSYKWKRPEVKSDSLHQSKGKLFMGATMAYEYTSRNFSMIERFREVEFDRNWNVRGLALTGEQHIGEIGFNAGNKKWGSAGLGADAFKAGNDFSGIKIKGQTDIKTNTFKASVFSSYLITEGLRNSTFFRHKSDLSKSIGGIKLGFKDERELNLFQIGKSDSLSVASYQFYDWQTSIGNADTTKRQITFYYRDRSDRRTDTLRLVPVARADQYGAIFALRSNRNQQLQLNISNRRLRIIDPERYSQLPENTLLARLEYNFRLFENFIQGNTFYEIGSGLEQKREFIYLAVPAGQGLYVWNDYNGDGLKDLNEFEIAQFSYEANYIRVFVQTNQYIRTYGNQFSQTLTLSPSRLWKSPTDEWQKFLSKFSDQASYKVDRKTNREQETDRFNPFLTAVADSNLLSLNGSFRNVIFFNKTDPKFGLDYTYQEVRNKTLLSDGFESRGDQYHQTGLRWNFIQVYTLNIDLKQGLKRVASDFLSGRNYAINYLQVKPKVTWQPSTKTRLALLGEYSNKLNSVSENREQANILKIGVELTMNSLEKGSVQATMNVYNIRYNGASNSSLAFDMLEGLNPGRNYVWTLSFQRTVAKSLQLNLLYNGRKPQDIKTIHSGGLQVRAYF